MRKLALIVLGMFLLLGGGCTKETKKNQEQNQAEDYEDFPVTIEHDDEEIIINHKPENILPMSLEMAEIVFDLVDDPDRVTAVTDGVTDPVLSTHADLGKEVSNRIQAASNIDPEEIISYDTDLLLLVKMYGEQEDAEKTFAQIDTPMLSFDPIVTMDDFFESMKIIGKALGESEQAEDKIADVKEEIASIQSEIPEDESPRVLVLSEVGGDVGPMMMGPTNISYDLLQLAGATPAVDEIGLERSTPAAIEQIMNMDPEYIVLVDFYGKGDEGYQELMEDPAWETLQAIEKDQVEIIDAKYMINPNLENIKGLKMLTEFIYD